jgi:predicted permease
MSLMRRLWNVVRRSDLQREIDEEIRFHLDERIRENIESGMSAAEARRDALRRFGSPALARERTRDADVLVTLETFLQDIAYAGRSLRRQPTFAIVAVLTLALGIGVSTAIYAVVRGVLLRPLRFPDSDRLFVVSYQPRSSPFWLHPMLSDRHYTALREADRSFEATTTFAGAPVTLTGAGDPVRLESAAVTRDFFKVLRVEAAAGRTFASAPVPDRVAVLGDRLWRARFGANTAVIGRPIVLDGVTHTVIGIMPPGFVYPPRTEIWTPLDLRDQPGLSFNRPAIGRLRPHVSAAQARAAWEALAAGLPLAPEETRGAWSARLIPLRDAVVGDVRVPLLIFTGAVTVVLVIACVNVSNLLLMRVVSRRREIAARLALGASRGRIVRQLLTESIVLACAAGLAGALVAVASLPALLAIVPPGRLPRHTELEIDGWIIACAFGLSLVCGIALALVPALHATRDAASGGWRESGSRTTIAPDRIRHALVVSEVALAVVLAVGAGLLIRSFLRLAAVDAGVQPANVMTMTVDLPSSRYPTAAHLHAFHERLLGSLQLLPAVDAAAAVNWLPLGDMMIRGDVQVSGGRRLPPGAAWVMKASVSPGYLRAMGIRLVGGRDLTARDSRGAEGVALVSESAARRLWPGENALGQQISVMNRPDGAADWLTIVGIVADVRQGGLKEDLVPAVYQPYLQVERPFFLSRMTFVIRTAGDPARVAPAMRAALASADGSLAPESIASMEEIVAGTVAEPRFQTRLLAMFSTLALALAAIGVYGVLSAWVGERRREMGIRIALGADPPKLLRMVLRRVLLLAASGVSLGVAGALALSRLLATLLFEIEPTDSTTFATAGALILLVALAAGLVPARRASTVDPALVLRLE